jgi:hypothetical protein
MRGRLLSSGPARLPALACARLSFIRSAARAAIWSFRCRPSPSPDKQKQALAMAQQTIEAIGQARLQMSFALHGAVSYPLLSIVIAWAIALFFGFGLMSKGNAMSVVALACGAAAVASAMYDPESELALFGAVSRLAGAASTGPRADGPGPKETSAAAGDGRGPSQDGLC